MNFLKEALLPQEKKKVINKEVTFLQFSKKVIEDLILEQRTGNAIVYQTAVNRIMGFCNNTSIKFSEINYTFLDAFKRQLIIEGVKVNTVGNYFRSIRAIFNKAIQQKLVERSYYPFYDLKIKSERTLKRAVLRQDLTKLEQLQLKKNTAEWKALMSFLLSFYLIGISFTDLAYLSRKNIIDGRVVYRRRKTHKEYSIKLFPQALAILESFYQEDSKYLIPVLPNDVMEDSLIPQVHFYNSR
jgi:integrase